MEEEHGFTQGQSSDSGGQASKEAGWLAEGSAGLKETDPAVREPRRKPTEPSPRAASEGDDPPEASGVRCPVCNLEVNGADEEDLSEAFRRHLATTHKDEPFVTQLMETIGRG
jgi:hypothetical protein